MAQPTKCSPLTTRSPSTVYTGRWEKGCFNLQPRVYSSAFSLLAAPSTHHSTVLFKVAASFLVAQMVLILMSQQNLTPQITFLFLQHEALRGVCDLLVSGFLPTHHPPVHISFARLPISKCRASFGVGDHTSLPPPPYILLLHVLTIMALKCHMCSGHCNFPSRARPCFLKSTYFLPTSSPNVPLTSKSSS